VIQSIVDLQEKNPHAFVMLTAMVPNFDGEYATFIRWGRILRNADGKVTAIREAKDATSEELAVTEVNPAIFAFDARWGFEALESIKNANASGEYYLTDLVAAAMRAGLSIVTASANPLEVIGINSPEELIRAERMMNSN
jgi:bifunctional UDP-N-acetylglucosamine pyrophosphorylase/glucosamine-1-phosphate N-acetyltransferase